MLKRHNKNSNSLRRGLYSSLEQSYSPLRKVCSARRKTYSRKISCFSIAGACCKLSGVCLLLLASLLVNPTTTSVYAFDSAPDDSGTGNTGSTGSNSSSSTITSTVNIAFTPESGSASLTPISADGASAKYSIKATVGVENSGGYTVYLGSNKSELTGKNTGETINGVNSSATYEELPLNTWGYNAIEGETPGTTFSKVPTNNRGDIIASNNSTNIKEDNKTFTLSFAAHIGNDKPADTYENEITLSVISSPLEITGLTSITNMQEMTPEICKASTVGDAKQLIDLRDNKSYWVAKLKDNNCWMVQNLDLDIKSSGVIASSKNGETFSWNGSSAYPPVDTSTSMPVSGVSTAATNTLSWDQGLYVYSTPTATTSCGSQKTGLSNCGAAGFVNVTGWTPSNDPDFASKTNYVGTDGSTTCTKNTNTAANAGASNVCKIYDAHYLVGNYYTWNAATAGTGGKITAQNATGSICPANWVMPTSNTTEKGSFSYLLSQYGVATTFIGTDADGVQYNVNLSPLFFVRAGYVDIDDFMIWPAGQRGYYWSASASDANNAYMLYLDGTTSGVNANSNDNSRRRQGRTLRCVVGDATSSGNAGIPDDF